ncbi:MAG: DUF1802 family protein [SAR202 cluster bacterium]|jgi:hypothetical protein|nr:DUF1802 family protein [SAR202 cluster bacterium]MDP6714857.1 DUF1802 family protein [SAR202 cluster bacterium]
MLLPPVSDLALKEWAVAVKALSRGDQVMILRKGGIHIEDKDFRMVHPEFLLYPTYAHQKVELLKPAHHNSLEETFGDDDIPGLVTLGVWCHVTDKFELEDESVLNTLSEFHIWTDNYAQARLHWRPKSPLTVALLRVYELQQPQALPILDEYNGCKSWVELGQDVPLGYMTPVLSDADYETRADEVRKTLGASPSAV